MKDSEYTYAVARIRVHETKLLTESELNTVIAAKSHEEAVRRLREKGYDLTDGDAEALDKKLRETWELLQSILPDERQMDAVLIKNDFHNLKVILKALVNEKSTDGLFRFPSKYDPEELKALVFARQNDKLPPELQHCDRSAYNILTKTRFAQLGDSVIDRAAMEWSIDYAKKADDPMIEKLAQLQAALTDIKVIYRCILTGKADSFKKRAVCDCSYFSKQTLIDAAQTLNDFFAFLASTPLQNAGRALEESPAVFEKYADDAVTELLTAGKSEIFGITPLLGYWFAVNTEILNLRIILSGKATGQSDEIIRERMRKTYV
ncbi:MAG: V-type ATPase subunit [Clostridia bacterium]|nr:V-type ATPase subunit [Clostridia bacterium]